MASIKMTPPTEIYVVIAHTTYDLSASPLNMYTDRRAAEEHARIAGVEVQVYLRHGGMTASSSDNADDESEPEPEPETKKTKTAKKPKAAKAEGAAKKVSKRAAVPEGDAQSLAGKTCMSVGHLHHMDHKTFTQTVVAYGGTPTTKLADVDFLVVGANAGKKVDEAAVLRVNTMTEEEFFDTIGAYYPDPPAKKAKK